MVEKWPFYFRPPFGSLNGFLFSKRFTVGCLTLEGRASAENRGQLSWLGGGLAGVRRPDKAWGERAGFLTAPRTPGKYE